MESAGTIELVLGSGYDLRVDFGLPDSPALVTDSAPPLGQGAGPDAEKLLMAAVGNCLSTSLAFALRKYKNDVTLRTAVTGTLARNEQNRLRMHSLAVDLHLGSPAAAYEHLDRALAQFEELCIVTQSVR
jgi:organic hydroperoxide reductase OsmC/OhrA